MNLHLLHLISVAAWIGVIGAELVLELLPLRRPDLQAATAVFHYYIDLCVELPLLLAILATGALLLIGSPIDARLAIKLAGAAVALAANFACIVVVVRRHRGPQSEIKRRTMLIYTTVGVGVPGGVVALYIGLGYVGS